MFCSLIVAHRLSHLAEYVPENIWRTAKVSKSSRPWAFRIDPIEGEARPRPEDIKFVDALVTFVHSLGLVHLLN